MISPIKKHKSLINVDGIKDIAYDTLFTKYIIQNLTGKEKQTEIETTDQEGLMIQLNGGFPIPGFIYTFLYPPTKGDEIKIQSGLKVKKYVDYVPLSFCLSLGNGTFSGINLNTLPSLERVKFLEAYYDTYKSFFKDIENITENNKLALNKKFLTTIASNDGQLLLQNFSKKMGANFNYGYRNYNIKRVKQLRMIEYNEWNLIPFYSPKDAFKLMNQTQIHSAYWKTL